MRDVEVGQAVAGRKFLNARDLAIVLAAGRLAEGAPGPLERAGVSVEHDDAMVAVAVGDEHLVGLRQDVRIRGAMHVRGVAVALALVALADLEHGLAVERELDELIVGHGLQSRRARCRALIAADPRETLVIDADAVLALGPFVARAFAAPALDEIAGRVEHHHGRRGLGHVLGLERARAVQDVGVVPRIDRDAGDVAELVLVRHLRP